MSLIARGSCFLYFSHWSCGSRWLLAALAAVLIAGCSSNDETPEGLSEEEVYQEAMKNLAADQYDIAINNLQFLEARFPFGKYAEQAQLELIYAYYKSYDHSAAAAAADRFIRLHPQHPNVDYAYYMKGLATFTEGEGLFERFAPTDLTKRDPGAARESFAYFAELLNKYPTSPYAQDARNRMVYLRNLLARYEIHAANYYFKRGAVLAAVNRGKYVVENFQESPAVPDGLAVMVQGYTLLDMPELANDALKVLRSNFPDHPALNEQGGFRYYEQLSGERRSWLNTLSMGLFDQPPPLFDSREQYNPEYWDKNQDED